ncbi:MAG TPA: hypothetical protein VM260_26780, partial [Pirellula sp.]|nr:hypothetical protein [Pirellula sp.]
MNVRFVAKTSISLSFWLFCGTMFLNPSLIADEGNPIAIRWWGSNSISIETHWNFEIAINPLGEDKSGDLLVLTQSCTTDAAKLSRNVFAYDLRGNAASAVSSTQVLDRWPNQDRASWSSFNPQSNPSPNAVRVTNMAEKGGAIQLEVDGIRILFCDQLSLQLLSGTQLEQLNGLDVLALLPISNDPAEIVSWLERLKPRLFIPLKLGEKPEAAGTFDWLVQGLGNKVEAKQVDGNTLAVRAAKVTDEQKTKLILMDAIPWQMPNELAELFRRKDQACHASQDVFAKLSVSQMNFRPSNGTHTARWNAEHMMGRELGFFSQIYASLEPGITSMDLNPKQMPPDYVAAHSDWTGKEEARQMERVRRFSSRFAYLLKDLPLDKKAPASFWTPKSLLLQMDKHYSEHTANVVKKFELSDWPNARANLNVWPDLAPGESSRETGTLLPTKAGESKPIDRVSDVRWPTLDVYPAKVNSTGTAVIILPGGGFTYVVPNLEGSEAAEWLNEIGVTVFVLRYRTKESAALGEPLWQRPLQDIQRAIRLIRHDAQRWQIHSDRIGILGFSAGGQVGAIAHAKADHAIYDAVDGVDKTACKPDFSILIYPWQILDAKTGD